MKKPRWYEKGVVRASVGTVHASLWFLVSKAFLGASQTAQDEAEHLKQLDQAIGSSGAVPPELSVGGHTYHSGDLSVTGAHNLLDTFINIETGDARLNAIMAVGSFAVAATGAILTLVGFSNRLAAYLDRRLD